MNLQDSVELVCRELSRSQHLALNDERTINRWDILDEIREAFAYLQYLLNLEESDEG